ncbi:MAG: serine O-acetyltransferase [Acidithiobacillus sp.]|nr:serine O-acetyltransferase [Acidithiobacillus sp.]
MANTWRSYLDSIAARDPAARNRLEILLTYPGVHAVLAYRLAHWLWQHHFRLLARLLSSIARWATGIEIHPGASIGKNFFIDHGMGVVIGETAEIGHDCTLYHGVTLGGTSWKPGKRHPTLEDNVIVGAGAKVLGPIRVGAGARIGSNAVVVKDVPAGATVVGIPGRVVNKGAQGGHFDAYGLTGQMPDPVARAMECMLAHMQHQDQELAQLREQLARILPGTQEIRIQDTPACGPEEGGTAADNS